MIPGNLGIIFTGDTQYPPRESGERRGVQNVKDFFSFFLGGGAEREAGGAEGEAVISSCGVTAL